MLGNYERLNIMRCGKMSTLIMIGITLCLLQAGTGSVDAQFMYSPDGIVPIPLLPKGNQPTSLTKGIDGRYYVTLSGREVLVYAYNTSVVNGAPYILDQRLVFDHEIIDLDFDRNENIYVLGRQSIYADDSNFTGISIYTPLPEMKLRTRFNGWMDLSRGIKVDLIEPQDLAIYRDSVYVIDANFAETPQSESYGWLVRYDNLGHLMSQTNGRSTYIIQNDQVVAELELTGCGSLSGPIDLTINDAGNIYIAQVNPIGGEYIVIFSADLTTCSIFTPAANNIPHQLEVNNYTHQLYVGFQSDAIEVYDLDNAGTLIGRFSGFDAPTGMILTMEQNLLVADFGGSRLLFYELDLPLITSGCEIRFNPTVIYEGDQFTLTLGCNTLSNEAYGVQIGYSFNEAFLIEQQSSSYMPGQFAKNANSNIFTLTNQVQPDSGYYIASRTNPAREVNAPFTIGDVSYKTRTGLTSDQQAIFSFSPPLINSNTEAELLISDINGDAILGAFTTTNFALEVMDRSSLDISLLSESGAAIIGVDGANGMIDQNNPSIVQNNNLIWTDQFEDRVITINEADLLYHARCIGGVLIVNESLNVATINLLPGDADNDEDIDQADVAVIQNNYDGSGSGDINRDGTVNVLDLIHIGRNLHVSNPRCVP